jgi:mono/diheme cytochrome c family protein
MYGKHFPTTKASQPMSWAGSKLWSLATVVVTAISVSSAWGAGDHAGGHHDEQAHWMAPADAASKTNPISATAESLARGAEIYKANCVTCHGAEGEGDGPAGAALRPPPANLKVMAPQHSDGDLAWKITEGRGAMPPWKGALSEEDIWNVVNYLKQMSVAKNAGKGHHEDGHGHAHK